MLVRSPNNCNVWGWASPKQKAAFRSPMWVQGSMYLDHPLLLPQTHQQRADLEVEQVGQELELI